MIENTPPPKVKEPLPEDWPGRATPERIAKVTRDQGGGEMINLYWPYATDRAWSQSNSYRVREITFEYIAYGRPFTLHRHKSGNACGEECRSWAPVDLIRGDDGALY